MYQAAWKPEDRPLQNAHAHSAKIKGNRSGLTYIARGGQVEVCDTPAAR